MAGLVVSSPGRVCLLGDHCDWAGGACLSASIPLRLTATVLPRLDRLLVVESAVAGGTLRGAYSFDEPGFSPDDPLRYAAAAIVALRDHGLVLKGTEMRVTTALPARRGLGSSAAFTILVLKALARASGHEPGPMELAELAYRAERELLGIPCGRMDQAASVHPRPVYLSFSGGGMAVEEIDLPVRIHLVVGDAGGTKDTLGILDCLNRRRFAAPAPGALPDAVAAAAPRGVPYAFERLFPELVKQGRDALLAGDLRGLGASMTVCQAVYDEYLVPACDELAAPGMHRLLGVCRDAQSLGQKWTGSGGESSFIALARDEEHQGVLAAALRAAGGGAIPVTLGG